MGVLIGRGLPRRSVRDIVEPADDGVIVNVLVQPRAGTTQVTGRHGNALRIRVAAPPIDGRATEAARRALADVLAVPATTVTLAGGARSRAKRFLVAGISLADATARIGALVAAGEG